MYLGISKLNLKEILSIFIQKENLEISTHSLSVTNMAAAPETANPVPPAEEATSTKAAGSQDINPWSVSGEVGEDGKVKAIDYTKLVAEFGTSLIDDALLERFEKVTGHKPHRFMRRGIVFSHRDLTKILDKYEKVNTSMIKL